MNALNMYGRVPDHINQLNINFDNSQETYLFAYFKKVILDDISYGSPKTQLD